LASKFDIRQCCHASHLPMRPPSDGRAVDAGMRLLRRLRQRRDLRPRH
jgi:hypothetical protein